MVDQESQDGQEPQDERVLLYQRALELLQAGHSERQVSQALGVARSTIYLWKDRNKRGLGPPGEQFRRRRAPIPLETVEPKEDEPVTPSATKEALPAPVYLRAIYDSLRAVGLEGSFGEWIIDSMLDYLELCGIKLILSMPGMPEPAPLTAEQAERLGTAIQEAA